MTTTTAVMAATDEQPAYIEHPRLRPEVIEERDYQVELAETARQDHTLVCLPTGLGKTTISLLVTVDRLETPDDKVLFLAPTKPLVEQHAAFYRDALAMPAEHIVVFTGDVSPAKRGTAWKDARVIVATPQVIENDLIGERISLAPVVHLTFDECHRASGQYAYNFIADRYHETARKPLVTGMSASPGDSAEAIQVVCENLGINEIAVKTDDDPSVKPYTFETTLEWEEVELPEEIHAIRDRLQAVIKDRLEELKEMGVTRTTNPELSHRDLTSMRGKLQGMIDSGNADGYRGMSLHAEIMKIKRAVEIAETQSIEAVRRYFDRQQEDARSSGASKATTRMVRDHRVRQAIELAEEFDSIHPKFSRARILIAKTLGIEGGERVIVFTESRDTAEVLTDFLGSSFSVERFVGQGDRDGSDGMTQTEQRDVLDAFRKQKFEVLVSTSVAEEGLDVPEVDLVLFFEPVPTAIRAIQRRGRTGRHAPGRVVVLLAKDTRDEAYFWISRRREQEMAEELRGLKDIEGDLATALGPDNAGLDDFGMTDEGEIDVTQPDDGQAGLDTFEEESPPKPDPGNDGGCTIVADQRELDSTIGRELSRRDGVSIQLETLDVGDYVLSDRVVVERKTVDDFLETLLGGDRSLFDQIGAMATHYDRPVVIVEGTDLYAARNVHPNAIRGALASLAIDYGASILFSEDELGTTALLELIAKREQEHGGRTVSVHGEKGGRTLSEQQEYVISSIADIGPVTARSLLDEFDTVEAIMCATEEELQAASGVGAITAARIREVTATTYDP